MVDAGMGCEPSKAALLREKTLLQQFSSDDILLVAGLSVGWAGSRRLDALRQGLLPRLSRPWPWGEGKP